MPTGRIFTVGRDTHKTLECADDKEAVKKATQLTNGLDSRDLGRNLRTGSIREIWDDARRVVRLPGSLSLK
jgi:hypothetical protein